MFNDKKIKTAIEKNGFVRLDGFSALEIDRAKKIFTEFENTHHKSSEKFRGTGWIDDIPQRLKVSEQLSRVFAPVLEKHFTDYRLLGCNFLLKEPGSDSGVPFHQDWTLVDEAKFCSITLWIPLEDTTEQNGCLFMVPYSHRIGKYLRPAPEYPIPFRNIHKLLHQLKKPIRLKAGEAVCFNNKTIHGSYPNLGKTFRPAVVATLYASPSPLLHHFVHDTSRPEKITEYIIEPSTLLSLNRRQPPAQYIHAKQLIIEYPTYSSLGYALKWCGYAINSFFSIKGREV